LFKEQRRCVQQKAHLRSAILQTGAHRRDASQLTGQPVAGRLRRKTQTKHPSHPPSFFKGKVAQIQQTSGCPIFIISTNLMSKLNMAMQKLECE